MFLPGGHGLTAIATATSRLVTFNFLETTMMTRQRLAKPPHWLAPIGLTALLLAGCGGGETGSSSTTPTEQPASVQITETASALSVRSLLPTDSANTSTNTAAATPARSASGVGEAEGTETSSETQAVQYTLKLTSGPAGAGATTLLQGTLALRAESENGGEMELEGRFMPTVAASTAPAEGAASAITRAAFDAQRAALKATLKAAVEAAKSAFDTARADPAGDKAAARSAFKAAVVKAVTDYRSSLESAAAAAGISVASRQGGDQGNAKGIKVKGSIAGISASATASAGALNLTLDQRGPGKLVLTGTAAPSNLGSMVLTGQFTGQFNGVDVSGDWEAKPATPADPPLSPIPPPPVTPPVTSPPVVAPPPVVTPPVVTPPVVTPPVVTPPVVTPPVVTPPVVTPPVVTPPVVTPPVTPPAPIGNVAAGSAKYATNCSGCHGTGKASDTKVNTAAKLTTVMNSIGSHSGLRTSLSDQDRLDIAAYVASPK